jgi:hypothetical protein
MQDTAVLTRSGAVFATVPCPTAVVFAASHALGDGRVFFWLQEPRSSMSAAVSALRALAAPGPVVPPALSGRSDMARLFGMLLGLSPSRKRESPARPPCVRDKRVERADDASDSVSTDDSAGDEAVLVAAEFACASEDVRGLSAPGARPVCRSLLPMMSPPAITASGSEPQSPASPMRGRTDGAAQGASSSSPASPQVGHKTAGDHSAERG